MSDRTFYIMRTDHDSLEALIDAVNADLAIDDDMPWKLGYRLAWLLGWMWGKFCLFGRWFSYVMG